MKIIKCSVYNARALAMIVFNAWQELYGDILSPGILKADSTKRHIELLESFYAAGLQNNWFEAFFIVEAHSRIGCCIIGQSKDADADFDVAEILGLYINGDSRYKSFDSKALTFIEDRLRQQHYRKIKLWMLSGNMRPITFYRKYGYKPDGATRVAVLGDENMEIRFAKTL